MSEGLKERIEKLADMAFEQGLREGVRVERWRTKPLIDYLRNVVEYSIPPNQQLMRLLEEYDKTLLEEYDETAN